MSKLIKFNDNLLLTDVKMTTRFVEEKEENGNQWLGLC
jgi:hypothetical protein